MRKILLILSLLALSSCGAPATEAPAAMPPPAATEAPLPTVAEAAPQAVSSSVFIAPAPTSTNLPSPTPPPTTTPTLGPTETDTALPTLALPTVSTSAPALLPWDGLPTYPGDSQAGYAFRVFYDPDKWALTTDNFGSPALAHRTIGDCIIVPSVGHGLPSNITVDHDVRKIGKIEYEINTAYLNTVPQFVTYLGGDLKIYTGFEVSFKEQFDLCIKDAEAVLGSLISIPISQATPFP